MPRRFIKDPQAHLDYQVDWEEWLDSDTILTAEWSVPADLTLVAQSSTATVATVWLSGGTAGMDHSATCTITTAAGRTDERSIVIAVRER